MDETAQAAEAQQKAIERQQVEYVFGLTGGELMDEPWISLAQDEDGTMRSAQREYWYEGPPEYAAREDFPDRHDVSYRTVCHVDSGYCMMPPRELVDSEGIWKLVRTYRSSGEVECPCNDTTNERPKTGCPLCEAQGDDRGFIYLGDGCAELVYRLEKS